MKSEAVKGMAIFAAVLLALSLLFFAIIAIALMAVGLARVLWIWAALLFGYTGWELFRTVLLISVSLALTAMFFAFMKKAG